MKTLGTHFHEHRVRYRECDPMGVVYHTHYLDFFEAARTEALRETGISYRSIEEAGVFMPVIDLSVNYKRPAHYDDLLVIECRGFLSDSAVKVRFDYTVRRKDEKTVLADGPVPLCFLDRHRKRPVSAPDFVIKSMARGSHA